MGKTLHTFGLDHLQEDHFHGVKIIRDIQDVIDAPIPEEYIHARKSLNADQKVAFKKIIHHVKRQQPCVFFIEGPGGKGKTYLYCALYAKVRQLNEIVLPTASSGIAAANLPNGEQLIQGSSYPSICLLHSHVMYLNKDLCLENLPFGGKIVVFGGDFRQVLPVVPHQGQREAMVSSLVCSPLWPQSTKLHLTQNMRARADPCYADFLLSLGDGKLQDNESEYIKIPNQILTDFEEELDAITELSTTIFPSLHDHSSPTIEFTNRAILTPKNDDADRLNAIFINHFQGDSVTYRSFDTIIDDHCNIYPTEFLNTLCPGGMSPHELILKCDCPVILLRNMDPSSGLCNGTRLTCKRFYRNLIECEIVVGYHKGLRVLLPRVKLQPSSSLQFPVKFERKQFPVKLFFAMIINKAQGQTLDAVGIYLRQPCFSHVQLYVALSRARTSTKVKVVCGSDTERRVVGPTLNIVSFNVLKYAEII